MNTDLKNLAQKLEAGYRISAPEAVELLNKHTADELCELAGALRRTVCGNRFDSCSIMNARSGRCPENCKWCSQSAFHKTDIDIYPLVGEDEALEAARYNDKKGIGRFSLVTSGRAMSDREVEKCCSIFRKIGENCSIGLCASMGLLNQEQLRKLKESGIQRYHCNLETAPSYFPSLCTTHTTDDKIRTIKWAQQNGLEVCSGGIIGMGETMEQRIELAMTLRELGIRSIPVNVLNPIAGTPLENSEPLTDEEILRTFAIFRIINPDAEIRFAGGRTLIKHLEEKLLRSGVNASIMGDMLTTCGSDIESDRAMVRHHGFDI